MFRFFIFLFLAARGRQVRSFIRLSNRITLACFAQNGIARVQVNTIVAGSYVTLRQFSRAFKNNQPAANQGDIDDVYHIHHSGHDSRH